MGAHCHQEGRVAWGARSPIPRAEGWTTCQCLFRCPLLLPYCRSCWTRFGRGGGVDGPCCPTRHCCCWRGLL
eukprot:scaffold275180_cov13-Tisochrysis_lutea.AAC.1